MGEHELTLHWRMNGRVTIDVLQFGGMKNLVLVKALKGAVLLIHAVQEKARDVNHVDHSAGQVSCPVMLLKNARRKEEKKISTYRYFWGFAGVTFTFTMGAARMLCLASVSTASVMVASDRIVTHSPAITLTKYASEIIHT